MHWVCPGVAHAPLKPKMLLGFAETSRPAHYPEVVTLQPLAVCATLKRVFRGCIDFEQWELGTTIQNGQVCEQ